MTSAAYSRSECWKGNAFFYLAFLKYYITVIRAVFLRYLPVVSVCVGDRGGTVVKVLCYISEGRWFDSRWCH